MRAATMWPILVALAAIPVAAGAQTREPPIFDAHVHYNLDVGRPVPVETVFELWRRAGIRGVLLTSRPNDGTRELLAAAPPEFQAVAFARPYVVQSDVQTWFRDPAILAMIERELARGIYRGVGEFHIFGRDADSEGFARCVALAAQRGLWAHTGMTTPTARVDELLGRYPKLYGELSYRDGITQQDGGLTPAWRVLFMKYPKRFLLGSDTWVPQRWPTVPQLMQSYRDWLAQLPRDVAESIAWSNGAALFLGP